MYAVLRKATADLLGRPFQSGLIALTILAAAALLYLGLVTLTASSSPYIQQMERANSAHAWLYLSPGEDGRSLAAAITALPAVKAVTPLRERWTTWLVLPDEQTPRIQVVAMEPGVPKMDRYLIVQGRYLAAGDHRGAVLDASYARYFGLGVGDEIQVATPGGPRSLIVEGLFAETRMCHYPTCGGSHLYVLPEVHQVMAGQVGLHFMLGVQLHAPEQVSQFLSQARQLETETAQVGSSGSWQEIRGAHEMVNAMSFALILIVAVAAVVAAGLISANIISGAVLSQYREIGLLKALGFVPSQVLLLFASQNGLLAALGAGMGTFVGHVIVQRRLEPLAFSMGDSSLLQYQAGTGGQVVAVMLLIAILFSILAAWKAIVTPPHQVLTQGFAAPRARVPWSVRLVSWLRLPLPMILGIKDCAARPGRMVMTILSLAICLITIALSVSLSGVIDRIKNDPAFLGLNFDLQVTAGMMEPADADAAVRALSSAGSHYSLAFRTASLPDYEDGFYIQGVGGYPDQFHFAILDGRMVQGPDELILAPVIMDRLGVKIGEQVKVQIGTRSRELTVVGRYRSGQEMGQTGMTLLSTLQAIAPDAIATHTLIRVSPGFEPEDVRKELLETTQYRIKADLPAFELPPFVDDALGIVKLLAVLMAAIAGLSVLNAALITAREQMREVGIRKAIGMTPGQILASVGTGGAWLGLAGSLVGVPAGVVVSQALVGALAQLFGLGEIPAALPPVTLVWLVALGVGLSVLAAVPAAVWAGRLPTTQVLSAE